MNFLHGALMVGQPSPAGKKKKKALQARNRKSERDPIRPFYPSSMLRSSASRLLLPSCGIEAAKVSGFF